MKTKALIASFTLLFLSSISAQAADALSAEQIRSLIVGKTIHGVHLKKDFEFDVYFDEDGTVIRNVEGEVKTGEYSFDGDMLCLKMRKKNKCSTIVPNGDGTYRRLKKGKKHIIDWLSIKEGKQF